MSGVPLLLYTEDITIHIPYPGKLFCIDKHVNTMHVTDVIRDATSVLVARCG